MILSSTKYQRLHTWDCKNKLHLNTSLINDKSISSDLRPKLTSIHSNQPLLSFTSFQHYLEDCNQQQFLIKQTQKLNRSTHQAKTQAYFNYKRDKANSSHSRRTNPKNITLPDSSVHPFTPIENSNKTFYRHKPVRNLTSKSSSDQYRDQKTADDMFDDNYGTIDAWSSEQKLFSKHDTLVSSKSILQQKKLNSITKNPTLKTSQNSLTKPTHLSNTHISSSSEKQNNECKKPLKPKNPSHNKQNWPQPPSINQDQLFRPIQIPFKSHQLTSINELEQQILLSKRQQPFASISTNNCMNQQVFDSNPTQHCSNIKLLKKQFEYLCKDDFSPIENSYKSPSSLELNPSTTPNSQFKYFKRFPNHQNHSNATSYPFPTTNSKPNSATNISQQLNHSSPNILNILRSINSTTANQNCLYESKTPMKPKKITQTNTNTPHNIKKDGMKNINQQKQQFHSAIKDRKSQSAFHFTNQFNLIESAADKKLTDTLPDELIPNELMITVMSSFKSCDSRSKTREKWECKNGSLLSRIKSRLRSEKVSEIKENVGQKGQKGSSLFEKDFLRDQRERKVDEKEDQDFDDIHINQSMSSTMDMMQLMFQEVNGICEKNGQLEKLNILSEELKKCQKMVMGTKYINLGHKKYKYLNKATGLKDKSRNLSVKKEQRKNMIANLTITQLQGRHIEKLKKRFDLQSAS